MKILFLVLLSLLANLPQIAQAARPSHIIQFRQAPISLNKDRAYLLVQATYKKLAFPTIRHVLLRIPSPPELAAYRQARDAAFRQALPQLRNKAKDGIEPTVDQFVSYYEAPENAFPIWDGDYLLNGDLRTYLIEVPAGEYVIYGISWSDQGIVTRNCLETVKFEAKPGIITNMGALYADTANGASSTPYIESNLGPGYGGMTKALIFGQALRPANANSPVPPALAQFPVVPATYSAVGTFTDEGTYTINRLAPIPGILDYSEGHPVDVKTGKKLE